MPQTIIQSSECDLALALEVFYLGDGYALLIGEGSYFEPWRNFITALKVNIEKGLYHVSNRHFEIPLTKVQRLKLKKAGVPAVFIEDL